MISQKLKASWLIAVIATSIAACGGGGSATATNPGGPIGGITGTGAFVAFGTVTGFGSIIVNGIEYETSTATFTIDDDPGFQDDLSVGDIVLVKGTIDDDNITNGVAESVEFDDNVEGPIEAGSIDTATGSFMVLGQQVIADAFTSYDDSISPASLDGLADDDIVEISGHVKADGSIHATRIEDKLPGGEFEITGNVTEILTTTTFKIGERLTVDFTDALSVRNFPGSRPVETGDLVEAKGTYDSATMTLDATSLEFKGDRLAGDDGDHVEVQGFITDLRSQADFDVSDEVTVACGTGCTVTTEGAAGGTLAMDSKVEVKGRYEGDVLVATSVDIRLGNAIRVTAIVDSFDDKPTSASDEGSLVMLGITFGVDGGARTRFEDKSGQDPEFSNIDQIQPGDYLEVRGGLDGNGNLFAVIVELEELAVDVTVGDDTIIQGFLQDDPGALPFPPMSILDVIIRTNVNTVFEDENDNVINDPDMDFWPNVQAGSLIKAKGTNVTVSTDSPPVVTLDAEEVEIEME
jgi:hypothetical protein